MPPEVGAALGVALREHPAPTVVDVGVPEAAALEALLDVADATILVVQRAATSRCGVPYAWRRPRSAAGVVLVEESGRALGARDVADVLGLPVLATVSVRSSVARVVDAGVFPVRLPDALAKPAREVLARVGGSGREGRPPVTASAGRARVPRLGAPAPARAAVRSAHDGSHRTARPRWPACCARKHRCVRPRSHAACWTRWSTTSAASARWSAGSPIRT